MKTKEQIAFAFIEALTMEEKEAGEKGGFAALHDFMDANEALYLAGADQLPAVVIWDNMGPDEEDETKVQAMCDAMGECMEEINKQLGYHKCAS